MSTQTGTSSVGINLGGIKQKKSASKAGANAIQLTDYSGDLANRVDTWLDLKQQAKAIEGQMKVIEGKTKEDARAFLFKSNEGKDRPDTTVECVGKSGKMKVIFQDRYYPIQMNDDNADRIEQLKSSIKGHDDQLLKEDFVLSILGSAIPADQRQEFVDQLIQLLTLFGADDAITVKQTVGALKDVFHVRRHTLFTPEENEKINEVMPMTVMMRG
jgi:hypothetical protein|tara:strand:- start:15230 stop:15874 length:645 start_codon:yes stop_codon:yes gene_type:complete